MEQYLISCSLDAKDNYFTGESVNINFRLINQTHQMLFLLDWYTPLEGIFGEIFHVTRDGVEIPYKGMLVKRGDPVLEEYVALGPGESVSATVDLAEGYDVSTAGEYRVRFISKIFDITDDYSSIPHKRDKHQGQELRCNVVEFEILGDLLE